MHPVVLDSIIPINFKTLDSFSADRFVSYLVANPPGHVFSWRASFASLGEATEHKRGNVVGYSRLA